MANSAGNALCIFSLVLLGHSFVLYMGACLPFPASLPIGSVASSQSSLTDRWRSQRPVFSPNFLKIWDRKCCKSLLQLTLKWKSVLMEVRVWSHWRLAWEPVLTNTTGQESFSRCLLLTMWHKTLADWTSVVLELTEVLLTVAYRIKWTSAAGKGLLPFMFL